MIWVTADHHFYHANIIKYCNRPFKNVIEMNATLIKNWNDVIKPEDLVYHLGDFVFKNIDEYMMAEQLNGHITFIKGNHDRKHWLETATITYHQKKIFMCHDLQEYKDKIPIETDIILCGHSHEKWKFIEPNMVNVGVDVWKFKPVSLDAIISFIKQANKIVK